MSAGDPAGAVSRLETLRAKIDRCGTAPDRTDWVEDCAAQTRLRAQIDALVAELG